ncbi:MAG TPA: ATP-binding protein [Methylomirabilota bacterium]|nr:ATP-binding protein [Methylomirabilota bacterium]
MDDRSHRFDDLRELVAHLPMAVYVCDAAGAIRVHNLRAVELWGREPKLGDPDARFSGAASLFRPDGSVLDPADTPMAEALRHEGERTGELLIGRPDGSRLPVRMTAAALRDGHGAIIGTVNAFQDITPVREDEQDATRLAAINRAKDEFLAVLSHELRNPVGVIVNALAVLDQAAAPGSAHEQARGVIRRQAQQLARLLDDLLDVARITNGRIELKREPVDLAGAIAQAVEREQRRVDEKTQRLIVTTGDRPVIVMADPVRLQQILGNLLNNAHKYTPAGGSIWVTLEAEPERAVVTVRDDGIGVASDKLETIFDLFAQASTPSARRGGGLGIGLTLVRYLVALHGGAVLARSDGPGRGTEFVVRLPLSTAVARPAPPPAPSVAAPPRRILVVEDNEDGRQTLILMLRLLGHQVLEAASGADAVELAVRQSPDLVLLDVGLPDLDGYEVARQVRKRRGDRIRLVALTGYGQPTDRARSEDAGFDEHLVKPIDPSKLGAVIRRLTAS